MTQQDSPLLFINAQRLSWDIIHSFPPDGGLGLALREALAGGPQRDRLLASPSDVLEEGDCSLPDLGAVQVVENSEQEIHLVLASSQKAAAMPRKTPAFKMSPLAQVLWDAASDSDLRQELLSSPVQVLNAHGLEATADASVVMHENTESLFTFSLPAIESDEVRDARSVIAIGPVLGEPENLELSWKDPGTLIAVGNVDSTSADFLAEHLKQVAFDLDMDISGVKFLSSRGIGVIVETQKRLSETGFRIRLRNVPDAMKDLFEVFRLETVLELDDGILAEFLRLYRP